jgi:hypothetical protein
MEDKDKEQDKAAQEEKMRERKEQELREKHQRDAPSSPAAGGWGGDRFEFCFPGGTSIEMADGLARPIAEVRVGDRVRCWDWRCGALAEGRVDQTLVATVERLIRLDDGLAASPAHRILTQRGYVRFDEVRPGDLTFSISAMCLEPIRQVEEVSGSFQVFNLVVARFACFFAEGLLVEDQTGAEMSEVLAQAPLAASTPRDLHLQAV